MDPCSVSVIVDVAGPGCDWAENRNSQLPGSSHPIEAFALPFSTSYPAKFVDLSFNVESNKLEDVQPFKITIHQLPGFMIGEREFRGAGQYLCENLVAAGCLKRRIR